jgi:hypothetical protein
MLVERGMRALNAEVVGDEANKLKLANKAIAIFEQEQM